MNKFEKMMKQELDDSTPDLKDKIKEKAYFPSRQKVKFTHIAAPILAFCILLIVVITPVMVLDVNNNDTNTSVYYNKYTLSMVVKDSAAVSQSAGTIKNENPSIQIVYKQDKVLKAEALNKTGLAILQQSYSIANTNITIKEGVVGLDIKKATNRVIDEVKEKGYLVDNELDIIIKDEKGLVSNSEIDLIGNNIRDTFNQIKIGLMTEDELDDLEEIIEDNPDIYYNYFKEDIKNYLEKKYVDINTLLDVLFTEIKKDIPEINDKFEQKDDIEEYYENLPTYINEAVTNAIKEYQKNYDDDITEDIDINNLTGKDFVEIYEEVLDEYKEVVNAYNELRSNKIPDDIDDMLEDIYFKKLQND